MKILEQKLIPPEWWQRTIYCFHCKSRFQLEKSDYSILYNVTEGYDPRDRETYHSANVKCPVCAKECKV